VRVLCVCSWLTLLFGVGAGCIAYFICWLYTPGAEAAANVKSPEQASLNSQGAGGSRGGAGVELSSATIAKDVPNPQPAHTPPALHLSVGDTPAPASNVQS
jgi:hypothetical protein